MIGDPAVCRAVRDTVLKVVIALTLAFIADPNGYRGILQVDGYAAHYKLVRKDGGNDGVILDGCRRPASTDRILIAHSMQGTDASVAHWKNETVCGLSVAW